LVILALKGLGSAASARGEVEHGAGYYEEGLALAQECNDPNLIAALLNSLCFRLLPDPVELERSAALAEESLTMCRKGNNAYEETYALLNLGRIAVRLGDLMGARVRAVGALQLARQRSLMVWIPEGLELLAIVAGQSGQGERAARLLGAASMLEEQAGIVREQIEQSTREAFVVAARAAIGEDAWTAAFTAGHTLSLEEAIAEALANTGGEAVGGTTPPGKRAATNAAAAEQ
jgi:hypothetical protein